MLLQTTQHIIWKNNKDDLFSCFCGGTSQVKSYTNLFLAVVYFSDKLRCLEYPYYGLTTSLYCWYFCLLQKKCHTAKMPHRSMAILCLSVRKKDVRLVVHRYAAGYLAVFRRHKHFEISFKSVSCLYCVIHIKNMHIVT